MIKKVFITFDCELSVPTRDLLPGNNSIKRWKLLNIELNLATAVGQQSQQYRASPKALMGRQLRKGHFTWYHRY